MSKISNLDSKELKNLFSTSKLNYGIPQGPKIVNQRRTVSYKSDKTSYANSDDVIIDFGSTSEFIYGPNCYLSFDLTCSSADGLVGVGSGANVINVLKIVAKSGVNIEHIRDVATITAIQDKFTGCGDFISTTGGLMGYRHIAARTESGAHTEGDGKVFGVKRKCIIPMHHISGFFGQDRYIPISALGGLRLELTLNTGNVAFMEATAGTQTITVENMELVCDNYRMSDAILKYTEKLAESNRLFMTFPTYQWNKTSVSANTSTNIDLKLSVAKCLGVYARFRETKTTAADEGKRDSITGAAMTELTSYQWIVGSEYHPVKPVTSGVQAYAEALKAFGNLSNTTRPPYVTLTEYLAGEHCIGVELEKDLSHSLMSGTSTNNKNSISLEIQLTQARDVSTWIQYVQAVRVVEGNVRTER